jgi:hypothetical protein
MLPVNILRSCQRLLGCQSHAFSRHHIKTLCLELSCQLLQLLRLRHCCKCFACTIAKAEAATASRCCFSGWHACITLLLLLRCCGRCDACTCAKAEAASASPCSSSGRHVCATLLLLLLLLLGVAAAGCLELLQGKNMGLQ